jgi:hypothetical protein
VQGGGASAWLAEFIDDWCGTPWPHKCRGRCRARGRTPTPIRGTSPRAGSWEPLSSHRWAPGWARVH